MCCHRRSSDGPGGTIQIPGLPSKPPALEQGVNKRGNHGPGRIGCRCGVSNVSGTWWTPGDNVGGLSVLRDH